jgi:hypothetical protein
MMPTVLLLVCILAPQTPEPVALRPGVNPIFDIGRYQVVYRVGEGDWQAMPTGWSGHFEPGVGVSYDPQGHVDGRRAMLLHSPWMGGAGSVEVRYPLALPDESPIILQLAYAMDPRRRDESDGVTFGVRVEPEDAEALVVLDEHSESREWTEVEADLSAYAGRSVELVLSAEPGPSRNPSFDFSLFAEPEVLVGADADALSPADRLRRVQAVREPWAATRPTLAEVGHGDGSSVAPTVGCEFTAQVTESDEGLRLTYHGEDMEMSYVLDEEGLVAELPGGTVVDLGGVAFTGGDGPLEWDAGEPRIAGDAVVSEGMLRGQDEAIPATLEYRLAGKSLLVSATCAEAGVARMSAPSPSAAAWRREIDIPYLTGGRQWYLPDVGLYVGTILDWTASSASSHAGIEAHYGALSDGSRIPLRETAIITVSPYLPEILPSVPSAPSPWIDDLAGRVIVDDWMGDFDTTRRAIEAARLYGVEDLLVQVHVWQNGGYDAKLPDVLPANERMGGDAGLIAASTAARESGYRFGVHENYVDIYPDAPSWDEDLVARHPDGSMVEAWFNEGTGIQSFGYRADAIVPTAERFTPEVHERYDTTCSFIDVHCAVPPWFHVHFTAGDDIAGRFAPVWEAHTELWEMFREVHQGPVLGEGNNHWYWSGRMDGAEAQVDGGEHHVPFPDFDLLKIHPLVANHGMGYYARWLEEGYGAGILARMPLILADKYRSQEILYGHAGFIGSQWIPEPLLSVKQAWMLAPLQERYVPVHVADTAYYVAGEWVDGSTAVAAGDTRICRIAYENGLEIIVNQSHGPMATGGRALPPYGWLARGAGIEEAYVAEIEGQVVDYVRDDASIFADARGHAYRADAEGLPIEPLAPEIEPIGPREFEITYRWAVGGEMPASLPDPYSFVHFVDPDEDDAEGIAFQNDHPLPDGFLEWAPGEHLDGPHRVTVPDDVPPGVYEITVGILSGGARQILRGPTLGNLRYVVGAVEVGEDGTVRVAREGGPPGWEDPFAQYSERFNADGRSIDFGPLVTNGAVRVIDEGDSLRVYPLPQGLEFDLRLRPAEMGIAGDVLTVSALGPDGGEIASGTVELQEGLLPIPLGAPGVCSYRVGGGAL